MTSTLTRDDLRSLTPSVFASHPIDGVSDRYAFLPTSEVIGVMEEAGFHPVKASQTITRLPDHRPFARHLIRFRPTAYLGAPLNTDLPEIILSNSHNKTAAYSLSAGIHRQICSNGLTVASATLGSFSIRHSGNRDARNRIIDATAEIVSRMPAVMETINHWKGINLTRAEQLAFAERASEFKPNTAVKPAFLLTARRPEDAVNPDFSRNLWVTMNVCQEWLMSGGVQGVNARGRKVRTRPVKAVAADLAINRRLWSLAEAFSPN